MSLSSVGVRPTCYGMPFTLVFIDKHDHLLLIGDGCLRNEEEYLDWCVISVKKAKELNHNRLLFDNRTLSLELTQYEALEVADRLVEMGSQKLGFRVAVLSCKKTMDIAQFVETSFINRSLVYKSFDSQEEALKWLLS